MVTNLHLPTAWAFQRSFELALTEIASLIQEVTEEGTQLAVMGDFKCEWPKEFIAGVSRWARGSAAWGNPRAAAVAALAEAQELVPVCAPMPMPSFPSRGVDIDLVVCRGELPVERATTEL